MKYRFLPGIGFLLAACADTDKTLQGFTQARPELRQAAVGCWTVAADGAKRTPNRFDWVPPIIRLDTIIISRGDGGAHGLIRRLDTTGRELPRYLERGIDGINVWTADAASDSLRLTFNNAFSGSVLYVRLRDGSTPVDSMAGRAYEFTDDGPLPISRGAVALRRIPCPAMSDSARDGV